MKTKKLNKKLALNKNTVADLNSGNMNKAQGGDGPTSVGVLCENTCLCPTTHGVICHDTCECSSQGPICYNTCDC